MTNKTTKQAEHTPHNKNKKSAGRTNKMKTKQLSITDNKEEKLTSNSENQEQLGRHIMACIDLEANFKLYSYRVISPEIFIERNNAILQLLKAK